MGNKKKGKPVGQGRVAAAPATISEGRVGVDGDSQSANHDPLGELGEAESSLRNLLAEANDDSSWGHGTHTRRLVRELAWAAWDWLDLENPTPKTTKENTASREAVEQWLDED